VGRALRLIAEGAIDADGVAGLAARLAVSERHLHRELVREVGAGPLQLARARRAQTARLLLGQTDLPLTQVAFAAGFESVRQFNDTMRASFGRSPSELRERGNPGAEGGGRLTLRLPYRPPLAWGELLDYLARRATPGVEEVVGSRYRRAVALGGSAGIIELEPLGGSPHFLLRLRLGDVRDLGRVVGRCRRLLDLDADPSAIGDALSADPALAPLVAARPGLRTPGAVDGWEASARAVLGQQVSVPGARTLAARLVAALGEALAEPDGGITHLFPSAQAVAAADLSGLGITRGRAEALRSLALAVASGGLALDPGADREEMVGRLLRLLGVGPWTASYVAMRALGDPDAFPATDLGLRRATERLGLPSDPRGLTARAEAWRPWRAYAATHLWASQTRPRAGKEEG
jgi:AraC family transcriptional regulator of adaptative response / DNA-3-methyladenine glycosylase II